MQDQCQWFESSEATGGGTVLKPRCVTDDSSGISYPARMGIYAHDEQHNFQHSWAKYYIAKLVSLMGFEEFVRIGSMN